MLFTIGHSTHTLNEFVDLLRGANVGLVVDVRTLPGSTKFPHFNEESLQVSLPEHGIEYVRMAGLGGLRKKTPGIDATVNGLWRNASFHRYADYALTEDFAEAFTDLLQLVDSKNKDSVNVAVMCAEAVWWRCHRRIIADYALDRGRVVQHGSLPEASLTLGAVVDEVSRQVTYPTAEDES